MCGSKQLIVLIANCLVGSALILSGCSSGGSSTASSGTNADGEVLSSLTSGYSVPSDISAVPEDTTEGGSFLRSISALASAATVLRLDERTRLDT